MKKQKLRNPNGAGEPGDDQLPVYVPPKIVTYTSDELIEQIGPALTCSPSPCPTTPVFSPSGQRLPKR